MKPQQAWFTAEQHQPRFIPYAVIKTCRQEIDVSLTVRQYMRTAQGGWEYQDDQPLLRWARPVVHQLFNDVYDYFIAQLPEQAALER